MYCLSGRYIKLVYHSWILEFLNLSACQSTINQTKQKANYGVVWGLERFCISVYYDVADLRVQWATTEINWLSSMELDV